MPDLSPGARRAMAYWNVIEGAAREGIPTADMWEQIREAADELGRDGPGVSASDVSQLRSIATAIQNREGRLAGADPYERLDSRYVSEAPWARAAGARGALGVLQVRYQHTTIGPDGPETNWRTSVFQGALPRTVEELHAALAEDAAQLADKYGTGHVGYDSVQVLVV